MNINSIALPISGGFICLSLSLVAVVMALNRISQAIEELKRTDLEVKVE